MTGDDELALKKNEKVHPTLCKKFFKICAISTTTILTFNKKYKNVFIYSILKAFMPSSRKKRYKNVN